MVHVKILARCDSNPRNAVNDTSNVMHIANYALMLQTGCVAYLRPKLERHCATYWCALSTCNFAIRH
jgi:hypothetical protein